MWRIVEKVIISKKERRGREIFLIIYRDNRITRWWQLDERLHRWIRDGWDTCVGIIFLGWKPVGGLDRSLLGCIDAMALFADFNSPTCHSTFCHSVLDLPHHHQTSPFLPRQLHLQTQGTYTARYQCLQRLTFCIRSIDHLPSLHSHHYCRYSHDSFHFF